MPRPKIILDCDPGLDDALAILVAAAHTDLLGITTVSGNVPVASTTRNALLVTQIADIDVEVYPGADRPVLIEPKHAGHIHGASGMDGPAVPELTRQANRTDAVRFIIDTVRSTDDVWLVPIGPLTNIALAIHQAPDIIDKMAGISLMGGSAGPGNVTPSAEFNIWADPHAARMVFRSGVPRLIMAGLNLTTQLTVDRTVAQRLAELGSTTGTFASEVIEAYVQAGERMRNESSANLHDPCAVLALTHPELFTSAPRHVDVSVDDITMGMTVVDERGFGSGTTNLEVLYSIDRSTAIDVVVDCVGRYS